MRALASATVVVVGGLLGACTGANEDTALDPVVADGRAAAARLGCAACHGSDGTGVDGLGPSWVGLMGSEVLLEDGSEVTADREYVRRSIVEPSTQRATGFALEMPAYRLSDEDLELLLDYIEAVR